MPRVGLVDRAFAVQTFALPRQLVDARLTLWSCGHGEKEVGCGTCEVA